VHALVADPADPNTIWRQDHMGMFRTRNAGDSWERIEKGMPAPPTYRDYPNELAAMGAFGFPLAIDPRSKALYAVPLDADEYRAPRDGKFRVYRSRNGGDSWEPLAHGLPDSAHVAVLRAALATDTLEPCGVYVGTTAGTVHASRDGGESWQTLPAILPRILCVGAFEV
jgi:photosystem II stability/assembly factor-like uncharacterized protein